VRECSEMTTSKPRPTFYALASGGWRDYVTVLHLPYTVWNLAYVALGAAIAPHFVTSRMVWTMAAFALGLGVSAHALDELNGRPLATSIPSGVLVTLGVGALAGACAIGVWAALDWSHWLFALIAAGAFIVPAYNLEWFGGRFHGSWWLALAWGGLPILSAYLAQTGTLRAPAVLAAGYGCAMILVQRSLSTPVREARRRRGSLEGVEPMERALRILPVANVLLAAALVTARLT